MLARVEPVGAGQDFEHQGVIGHVCGHRAGVVDRHLDGHHAGIRHEAVRGFHAVDAAIGSRHANRATLVTADREIDLAGRDQRRAARGRTARRITVAMRVVHRPGKAGVRAAREAEHLAHGLADHRGAGIEQACDDGRVERGNEAFHGRRTVHHRHAGDADVVLDNHGLAGELAAGRAGDRGLDVPRAEFVLVRSGVVGLAAWVLDRGHEIGHFVDDVVGVEVGLKQLPIGLGLGVVEVDTETQSYCLNLAGRRTFDCHGELRGLRFAKAGSLHAASRPAIAQSASGETGMALRHGIVQTILSKSSIYLTWKVSRASTACAEGGAVACRC